MITFDILLLLQSAGKPMLENEIVSITGMDVETVKKKLVSLKKMGFVEEKNGKWQRKNISSW